MTEQMTQEVAEAGVRLLDEAHTAWFAAELECELALRAWFAATSPKGESAYRVYRAALEREEAAARDLQRLTAVTAPCRTALESRMEKRPLAPS